MEVHYKKVVKYNSVYLFLVALESIKLKRVISKQEMVTIIRRSTAYTEIIIMMLDKADNNKFLSI